jgi:hypothetical protein
MVIPQKIKLCGLLEVECVNKNKSILLPLLDFMFNNITCHEMFSFMDGYI